MDVVGGQYSYPLPNAFFPDFKKKGCRQDKAAFPYEFNYEVRIVTESRIANLSLPANATIVE